MDKIYYVYRWIRLDINKVFYVGRGKGRRYKQTKYGRNKYFRNIFLKADCEVEIMMEGLTLAESCTKEIEFIKLYKDIGQCVANMSSGGESGTSGVKPSTETRAKMSKASSGRTFSEEHKKKISKALIGRKLSEEHRQKMNKFKKSQKPWSFGKTFSDEHKAKLSAAKIDVYKGAKSPSAKKVIDTVTGTIFGCAKDAAAFLNIKYSTLTKMLSGFRPNRTTLRYLTTENI